MGKQESKYSVFEVNSSTGYQKSKSIWLYVSLCNILGEMLMYKRFKGYGTIYIYRIENGWNFTSTM